MGADFAPKDSVPVADSEEVHVAVPTHVRVRDVVILIHFHRVARRNALLRGE